MPVARLYRPSIPLEVKCRVVLRQTGEMWAGNVIEFYRKKRQLGKLLGKVLAELAQLLACEVADLRLDHDPALVNRKRYVRNGKVFYVPDANDADHLIYREKADHDIKTRVRGDGAQLSDLAIVRKRKRKERKAKAPRRKWPSRPMRSANRWNRSTTAR
jgi:hypothetical protein